MAPPAINFYDGRRRRSLFFVATERAFAKKVSLLRRKKANFSLKILLLLAGRKLFACPRTLLALDFSVERSLNLRRRQGAISLAPALLLLSSAGFARSLYFGPAMLSSDKGR